MLLFADIYAYYLRTEKEYGEKEAKEEAEDKYKDVIRQKISDLNRKPRSK